jgi:Lon protease-like protein
MTISPMFPLGAPLLPGEGLPLQVFEPRYLQMIRDCVVGPTREFGVVLIERGSEVGGGDERTMVGTMARLLYLSELAPMRLAVMTVGVRRIAVERWLDDDPYPRAEVSDLPDPAEADLDAAADVGFDVCLQKVQRVRALASELGANGATELHLSDEFAVATYQLAAAVPIGPADRHRILCADGPRHRLRLLDEALDDLEAVLRFRLGSAEP